MSTKKYFKAMFMLGIIVSLFQLSSCSKDDEPGNVSVNASFIIGTWQGVSSSGWEKEDGKIVDRWDNDDIYDYDFIEFKMDATGSWWDEGSSRKHNFSWYIDDDYELVIGETYVGDGTGDYYRFKKLTKDTMILISEDDDPEDGWYQEDTYKKVD